MGRCEPEMDEIGQISSDKVFYTGKYLPNLDINTNQTLTQILQILNNNSSDTPLNIKGGSFTQISDGLTLSYNIPHTLGSIPSAI